MIRDSFLHAEDDMGERLLAVERVEADRILQATAVALKTSADLLVEGEREAIEAAMAELEKRKAGRDHVAIRAAITALDAASKDFAARRMNRALEKGLRGQAIGAVETKVGKAMSRVRFEPDGVEIAVPPGTTILQAAQAAGAKLGSACGGACACSTCHVYVDEGLEGLSEIRENEEDILDKAFDVRRSSRLGCQAKLMQDRRYVVTITPASRKAYDDEHG